MRKAKSVVDSHDLISTIGAGFPPPNKFAVSNPKNLMTKPQAPIEHRPVLRIGMDGMTLANLSQAVSIFIHFRRGILKLPVRW